MTATHEEVTLKDIEGEIAQRRKDEAVVASLRRELVELENEENQVYASIPTPEGVMNAMAWRAGLPMTNPALMKIQKRREALQTNIAEASARLKPMSAEAHAYVTSKSAIEGMGVQDDAGLKEQMRLAKRYSEILQLEASGKAPAADQSEMNEIRKLLVISFGEHQADLAVHRRINAWKAAKIPQSQIEEWGKRHRSLSAKVAAALEAIQPMQQEAAKLKIDFESAAGKNTSLQTSIDDARRHNERAHGIYRFKPPVPGR